MMPSKRLTVQQRRQIFRTLVDTQDTRTMSVRESKDHVMQQFDISDDQLEQIVDEGVEKEWPPLNEPVSKAG
jgi:hypothetical protein